MFDTESKDFQVVETWQRFVQGLLGVLALIGAGVMAHYYAPPETASLQQQVHQLSRQVEDLNNCHLLFIGRSEKDRLAEILKTLSTSSIVTVSETDGFAQNGGIINFYTRARLRRRLFVFVFHPVNVMTGRSDGSRLRCRRCSGLQ